MESNYGLEEESDGTVFITSSAEVGGKKELKEWKNEKGASKKVKKKSMVDKKQVTQGNHWKFVVHEKN